MDSKDIKERFAQNIPLCNMCGAENSEFANPVSYWYDRDAEWDLYSCAKCTIKALKTYELTQRNFSNRPR